MIADIAARTTDGAKATFYPDHLLPALQSTLAVLADLDIRHEIDRDYLEEWSGPDEVRRHLVAELEAEWQRAREPLVLRLAELQGQMRTPACVTEEGPRGSPSIRQRLRVSSRSDARFPRSLVAGRGDAEHRSVAAGSG
jgi:hypothetical protein